MLVHMATPYRVQAIVEHKPLSNVFTYYIGKDKDYPLCPVCGDRIKNRAGDTQEGSPCYPTKRVVVKGFWFWRKRCPLPGIHRHFKCRECDAISIVHTANNPESESVSL